jgi:hypothetical protein
MFNGSLVFTLTRNLMRTVTSKPMPPRLNLNSSSGEPNCWTPRTMSNASRSSMKAS